MVKLAVVADSHFDEGSRFEECVRIHSQIARWCHENKLDALLHAGDVFEGTSTPRERAAVAEWIQDVANACPVVIVRGNHDKPQDIEFMSRLRAKNHIIALERPDVVRFTSGLQIACLPWPRKSELLASLGREVSQEEAGEVAKDALRDVLRGLGAGIDHASPAVFLGHVMARGSVTSTGQPLVGMDLEVGLEDLALATCHAYALGHIHMPQSWTIDGSPVFYPGSPRRTAFGELEDKGFTVIDLDDSTMCASTTFVPTNATRMIQLDGKFDDGSLVTPEGEFDGAEVRLRYRVESDRMEEARKAAELWRRAAIEAGAVSVKLEPEVIASTRLRAPEVVKASTLAEQLEAYWRTKDFEPGARRESLLGKLAQLETAQ